MSYNPLNQNGQAAMSNSEPVVIASDQTPIPTVLSSSSAALNAGIKATMTAYGYQRVTNEPRIEFVDAFDNTTIDITDKWNVLGSVISNTSSVKIGNILTTSTVNSLTSKVNFNVLGVSFQVMTFTMSTESNPLQTTNVNRFRGFGIHTGTPSLAVPVTQGVGFEWDASTGKLYGAVWQNGVRSASSIDLTSYVTSGTTRYALLYRSDLVIFYIGSIEIPVGSISFVVPNIQNLPIKLQTIIGSTTPSTTPLDSIGAVSVADTGGNATQLADGTNPWKKATIGSNVPQGSDNSLIVKNAPQTVIRNSFSKIFASSWDSEFWQQVSIGTGQTLSQASGNGLITTGTTANAETIVRSLSSIKGSFILRTQTILSQRIVNNNFFIELVDIIGDGLAASATSATVLVVTFPTTNPFTSANVGQSMFVGALGGGLVGVPNRYTIASVSGLSVTFTVAGFSVTSGTCSLFGWNYQRVLYDSTVATTAKYDTQRKGWNSGDTSITINTTASPGHMIIMSSEDNNAVISDQLVASSATLPITVRGSRVINIADESVALYLQIRALNGSTAPATTTTFTVGMVSLENYATQPVSLTSAKPQGSNAAQSVKVDNIPNIGSVSPGVGATNLGKSEDAVAASGDTGIFMLGVRRDTLSVNTSATADYSEIAVDKYGATIVKDQTRHKRTYSTSFTVVPATSATDIFQLIGSATTTVSINRITIIGTQTTGAQVPFSLIKRSTANTAGTLTTSTNVPNDASDAAATAVGSIYTANPTTGTAVGTIKTLPLFIGATSTTNNIIDWNFGERGKPIVLNGVAQALAISLGSSTLAGGSISVNIEFTEE